MPDQLLSQDVAVDLDLVGTSPDPWIAARLAQVDRGHREVVLSFGEPAADVVGIASDEVVAQHQVVARLVHECLSGVVLNDVVLDEEIVVVGVHR